MKDLTEIDDDEDVIPVIGDEPRFAGAGWVVRDAEGDATQLTGRVVNAGYGRHDAHCRLHRHQQTVVVQRQTCDRQVTDS